MVRLDTTGYRGGPNVACPAAAPSRAREPNVDPQLRDLAALVVTGLLFGAVVLVMVLARQRRALEIRLAVARAEVAELRRRLADETRPPTQFARMHLRDVALERFARLRLAMPRRSDAAEGTLGSIDLVH